MAIKTSYLEINKRLYVKTFSSLEGYGVKRDGIIYYEAVDPEELHREYTEVKLPEDMLPKEEDPKQEEESEQMVQ
jgi:hypothetical protein